jgi:hypothetical protein
MNTEKLGHAVGNSIVKAEQVNPITIMLTFANGEQMRILMQATRNFHNLEVTNFDSNGNSF